MCVCVKQQTKQSNNILQIEKKEIYLIKKKIHIMSNNYEKIDVNKHSTSIVSIDRS